MVQLENVSKFILEDVNLYIPEKTAVGLIGKSGAGKTTLLKLISGLLAPDTGRISTMRKNPLKYRKLYRDEISSYFAGIPLLSREDTVRTGYEMIASMYKLKKDDFEREYHALADGLGFGKYDMEVMKNISLGQRVRAELGAALLYHPKLLLLDEPTIGLDQTAKNRFRDVLAERVGQGMTLLVASHDMEEISHLCSRIVLLHHGKLEFYGSQEQLRMQYNSYSTMKIKMAGAFPDLGDIPFHKYVIENNLLTLVYSSNYITSAEILRQITRQTLVSEVVIEKPDLGQVIRRDFYSNRTNGEEAADE